MINIPELNYWANQILLESTITDVFFKLPPALSKLKWKSTNSILSLLFDQFFSADEYIIHFRQINFNSFDDSVLTSRISLYYSITNTYIVDTDIYSSKFKKELSTENVFNIDSEEENLLDKLFKFKTDSTSAVNISAITYGNLNSNLSKLIYIYLNYELNNDFSLYDTESTPFTTSDSNILHILYEKWLIDFFYKQKVKEYVIKDKINQTLHMLNQINITVTLTETEIINKQILFSPTQKPFNADDIEIIYNCKIQIKGKDFQYEDSPISRLYWNNLTLEANLQVEDKIYINWSYL